MPRYAILQAIFEVLAASRITPLLRKVSNSRGVILTLHRVLPDRPADFSPNAILQVTPEFLEHTIVRARDLGFEIVTIDEAVRRVRSPDSGEKPFLVLTFDDGYRDNLQYALPILRKHQAPFTLYVPTALIDGTGLVWWQALEDIISAQDRIDVSFGSDRKSWDCRTKKGKDLAFSEVYARYRDMPENGRVQSITILAERYGFDLTAHCRSLIMDWEQLQTFADEPLCTIGAHTVEHFELAKLPYDQMRDEIDRGADIIRTRLGTRPTHLSYPIGGPEAAGVREFETARTLGFTSAVTTRPGGIYPEHSAHLNALPRISLNGYFQKRRYIDVLLTAEVFRLMKRGRVLDVT